MTREQAAIRLMRLADSATDLAFSVDFAPLRWTLLRVADALDATALQILPDEEKNQPAKAAPPPFTGVESTGHHQE